MSKVRFLIIGGGTGGISVGARLKKQFPEDTIAIIEPSDSHYYQPLWTLVGAGLVKKEESRKTTKELIPSGVQWIQDSVLEVHPESNSVLLASQKNLGYEILVLAPGLKVDFYKIKGLEGHLGTNGLCSIYDFQQAEKTFEMIHSFKGGKALFTMPPVPIKCAGAPQKIMYLAEEIFRDLGIREKSEIHFYSNGPSIFGVPLFAKALEGVAKSRGIQTHFLLKLIEVKATEKIAVFEKVAPPVNPSNTPPAPNCAPHSGDPSFVPGETLTVPYDLLHVVPPNSAPDFISKSSLAWSEGPHKGWLKVDPYTLQNPDYKNIFGIGDVTGIPNAKTGAAIRKQAPLVIRNIISVLEGKPPLAHYDGYSSCPLVTSRKSVILAEFGYDGKILPTFPLDPTKERYIYWLLKRYLLPKMYWNGMLKGIL